MQAQDEDRQIQWTEGVDANADVYLKECASCGGQFPSFRAICSECEDVADLDGYRDGKKVGFRPGYR